MDGRADPLRVLFVASGEAGGAEYALATHLLHRPEWIDASVLLLTPGPAADLFAAVGLEVSAGSLGSPIRPRAMAAFARRLAGELRRARPAVVHATGVRAALACAPACRLRRMPLVWHKVDLAFDRRLTAPLSRPGGFSHSCRRRSGSTGPSPCRPTGPRPRSARSAASSSTRATPT